MLKKVFISILVLALLLLPIQAQFSHPTLVTSDIEFTNGKWIVKSFMSDGKVFNHSVDKLMRGIIGPQGQCADCQPYAYGQQGNCGSVSTWITLSEGNSDSVGECWLDDSQDPPVCAPEGLVCYVNRNIKFTNNGTRTSNISIWGEEASSWLAAFSLVPGHSVTMWVSRSGCGSQGHYKFKVEDVNASGEVVATCYTDVFLGCTICVN